MSRSLPKQKRLVRVAINVEASLWRTEPELLRTIKRAVEGTLLFFRNSSTQPSHLEHACWQASVLCSDDHGMQALSERFLAPCRTLDSLAFPSEDKRFEAKADEENYYLGDIALGYQGMMRTVSRFALDPQAHVAHLSVHASAHLLGMRHDKEEARHAMEHTEARILYDLGFPDSQPIDHDSVLASNASRAL